MANYAQTVNVIGCIKTTKTDACFAATALPLMLYRNHFGQLPVEVTNESVLDVSAALTKDKKTLTIGVVNPTTDTYMVNFDLLGATQRIMAKTWIITGNDRKLYNVPGEEPVLKIEEIANTNLQTGDVEIKPMSITLYSAPLRR